MIDIFKNKNTPNILTISRLFIIPIFILMVWYTTPVYRFIFLFFYVYATVTDFLDGYLAREYNLGSNFGRIMDPIADKALILIICIVILVRDTHIAQWLFIPIILILARELIISGMREGLISNNVIIPVSKLGKYKTTLQMLSLGFLISGGQENWFFILVTIVGVILLIVATVVSLLSALQYMVQFSKNLL